VRVRRQSGSSQTHVVIGLPIPKQGDPDMPAAVMAATVFGEGMSSPLLDRVRERLGLVYYAGCSADVTDLAGQFVIEASTTPEHLDALFAEVTTLLRRQADAIDPVQLARARNQLMVRSVRARERSQRRLEGAAQDLFVFDRVRPSGEWMAQVAAIDAEAVRQQFERMLKAPASAAVTGKVPAGSKERCQDRLATLQTQASPMG
jgi:predicted Zn-dependent peptidase